MGIITVDAAPDFARRYECASQPRVVVIAGVRRPAEIVPVKNVDGPAKKAAPCPAKRNRAPTNEHNDWTIFVLMVNCEMS